MENKKMIYRNLVVFSCFILLIAGCSTTQTVNTHRLSPVSSAEVQEISRIHHAYIQSIQGEGRISLETPDIAQSGSFILTLRKPDTILIAIRGPFGIKVGSALLTRTEFAFYSSLENLLVTGPTTAENLDRILHVRLSFDDMVRIFAGGVFLNDDLRTPDQIRVEEDQYVFIYTSGNTSRQYWIDPETSCIQKIQFLDWNGKVTLEQTFNAFEPVNGTLMPFSIRITQPKVRNILTLKYSDISLNTEPLQFTFTIPQNVERIRW